MKKNLLLLLIILLTGVATVNAQSRKKKDPINTATSVDSLILATYNSYEVKMLEMESQYDALTNEKQKEKVATKYDQLRAKCDAELLDIYKNYIHVDGVVQRVFSIRTSIPKSELQKIYDDIPPVAKVRDPYAASLKSHIEGYQVSPGDTIGNFKAVTSSGYDFNYAEFRNEKDVLLIFGNFESMTMEVKTMLSFLYAKVNSSKLEFLSFINATDVNDLKNKAIDNQIPWLVGSDFKDDRSPIRMAFGVTLEPYMVYISKGGGIYTMTTGLSDVIISKIQENSFN